MEMTIRIRIMNIKIRLNVISIQMTTVLNIKNMVCPRCILAVERILKEMGIEDTDVGLGEVKFANPLDDDIQRKLEIKLKELGFELLSNRNSQLVEKIKNTIISMVHHQHEPKKIGRLSEQIPNQLGLSYSFLSKLFSTQEGMTIEKYLILQKVEKAKELLIYGELNVSEIAFQLNYSSSQHFSRQFRAVTGLSPSLFIKRKKSGRKPLDGI